MLRPQLGLNMSIIEFTYEGLSPSLTGVDGDVHVVLPMPFPPFCFSHGKGIPDGC
jgi:hypothetical protein